jgi:hypothetical protein
MGSVAPAARAAAIRPSAVDSPRIGTRSAWARPFAVASPTRSPVKEPGPVPTATASRSAAVQPPSVSRRSILAISSSPCRKPASQASTQ